MGIKSKFKRFFELDDETYELETYEEEEPEQYEEERTSVKKTGNVVSLQSVQQNVKVILVEPRVYSEVQDIADQLKSHRAIAMNLQRVPHDQARRIVDFLSGTVYAIGGDIQKIGEHTFLCTPENVDVSGKISEVLDDDY
ncbi:cell division protein SepF [Pueribacillus theae]|uniref:Cell division protein SepF n=1 Tax=Pueribacillus theae TaxID=2171751 RepID=A0A2U1K822_9BACI|nr:cell division protein SepF [Pueribacillus theae]PWA13424.1 cell division protein SepF [Pueribacillus theae]